MPVIEYRGPQDERQGYSLCNPCKMLCEVGQAETGERRFIYRTRQRLDWERSAPAFTWNGRSRRKRSGSPGWRRATCPPRWSLPPQWGPPISSSTSLAALFVSRIIWPDVDSGDANASSELWNHLPGKHECSGWIREVGKPQHEVLDTQLGEGSQLPGDLA